MSPLSLCVLQAALPVSSWCAAVLYCQATGVSCLVGDQQPPLGRQGLGWLASQPAPSSRPSGCLLSPDLRGRHLLMLRGFEDLYLSCCVALRNMHDMHLPCGVVFAAL